MRRRPPRILVFQHMPAAHPGVLFDLLDADSIAWQPVRLDAGEPIPDLAGFDALLVMGGPQDVWQEAEHPWLASEKAAIREAVCGRRMPCLGICLGHQLLAEALGGEVGPMTAPEIGVVPVSHDGDHPWLDGVGPVSELVQWHGAEVRSPPPGARVLASSERCAVQAMAIDERTLGVQFHVEVKLETVAEWVAVPAYAALLDAALGDGGAARFLTDVRAAIAGSEAVARRIYDNFRQALTAAA